MIAWICRYGHQPIDVILKLDLYRLNKFQEALSELLEEERPDTTIVNEV
jgi:hypothetical protein